MDKLFFVGQEGEGDTVLFQGTAEDSIFREEEGGLGEGAGSGTQAENQETEEKEEQVQHRGKDTPDNGRCTDKGSVNAKVTVTRAKKCEQ
jgi:hypothetical protein